MRQHTNIFSLCLLFICALFCCNFLSAHSNIKQIEAETTAVIIQNNNEGIPDKNLYNALLGKNYNNLLPNGEIAKLTISSDMFKDLTHLDLSNSNIEYLFGLELLDLSNLRSVDLRQNNISVISNSTLEVLQNVEVLNISNNNLRVADFSTIKNIKELNLSYNKLSAVDLSFQKVNYTVKINLRSNNFNDYEKIKLNSENKYELDLIFNNFTEVDINKYENAICDYYIQNNFILKPTSTSKIITYSGYSYPNFNIKVYNQNNEVYCIIGLNENKTLSIGNYTLKFFNGSEPLYNDKDKNTEIFKDIQYKVAPQKTTYQIMQNSTLVDIPQNMVFYKDTEFVFYSLDNATIKISVNNSAFQNKESVKLSDVGTYSIKTKCVINGIESEVTTVYVTIKEKQIIPTSMIAIIALAGLAIVVIGLTIYAKKTVNFNKKEDKND